jgi:Tol biopolymer transport system component
MGRGIGALLVLPVVIGLAACGGGGDEAAVSATTQVPAGTEPVTVEFAAVSDSGFRRAVTGRAESDLFGATTRIRAGPPKILVRVSAISQFAQDGQRIAWIGGGGCPVVGVRDLRTGIDTNLPRCGKATDIFDLAPESLSIAGGRVVWAGITWAGNTEYGGSVFTAALHDRRERKICRDFEGEIGPDEYVEPEIHFSTAGDGPFLVMFCERGLSRVDQEGRVVPIPTDARRGASDFEAEDGRVVIATALAAGCVCLRDFAWAPDAARFAFARHDGEWTVVVADAAGTGARALGRGEAPAWSPDGKRLTVTRSFEGKFIVMDAEGRRRRTFEGDSPEWSPDGKRLTFVRDRPDVVIADLDGGRQRVFARSWDPEWSPDGTQIAFIRGRATGGELIVGQRDGTGLTVVASSSKLPLQDPQWSPDGTKIAFYDAEGINVVDVLTRFRRLIAPVGDGESAPSNREWAPDGRVLAIVREGEIYVVAADGSQSKRLTDAPELDDVPGWSPDIGRIAAWSPDGTKIAFLRETAGALTTQSVWVTNADGTNLRHLAPKASDYSGVSWSPDGSRIAFRGAPGDRGEFFAIRADGTGETQLTRTTPTKPRSIAEVVMAANGRIAGSIATEGRALAVSLSGSTVALLVQRESGNQLEFFDAGSGAFRRSVAVPATTAPELSAAGRVVVFRTGKEIRAVDAFGGVPRVVAIVSARPIGLSIEGNRVAWAENSGGRGRVRAVFLR